MPRFVMMEAPTNHLTERVMERFLTRHQNRIVGTSTGVDRLRFRGSLRSISDEKGVETCRPYGLRKDWAAEQLRLQRQERKCRHVSCHYLDREFGLMHVRLQTWMPFTMHIRVNGREWLARQLTAAQIRFRMLGTEHDAVPSLRPQRSLRATSLRLCVSVPRCAGSTASRD